MARQSALRSLRLFSSDDLHVFGNAVKRAVEQTSAASLSVGAIAGIAVSCGILFFIALSFLVICYSRRRHRRRCLASGRKLDLGDDDDGPVGTEHPPHDLGGSRSVSSKPLSHESDAKTNGWYTKSQGQGAVKTESGGLIPPAYAFHITGSRDSWPLVSWTTSPKPGVVEGPSMPPPAMIRNPNGPPSPDGSRPYPHAQGFPILLIPPQFGPPIQAKHARQLSRSSINLSKRRSATDNQLTTILRSTSERLRDSQAAGMASPTQTQSPGERDSILSPIGCDPPTEKAPSPLKGQATSESRRDLAPSPSLRDDSHSSSPKSSVLDLFSGASRAPSRAASTRQAGRETPQPANPSDDEDDNDSLCGTTPDLVIPAALTSPSKRENRTDLEQRHRMCISSQENTGSKIHEDNRASLVPFGACDSFANETKSLRTKNRKNREVTDDPFVIKGSNAAQLQSRAPSPFLTCSGLPPRKTTFGASNDLPLRSVAGNNQSNTVPEPAKRLPTDMGIMQLQNSFNWISHPTDYTKPSQPQIIGGGIAQPQTKGHQRSKVVRLQGPPLQRNSIAIVPEENEEGTPPKSLSNTAETALSTVTTVPGLNCIVPPPRSSSRLSIMTDRSSLNSAPPSPSSMYNSRPPSLSQFHFQSVASSTVREIPGHGPQNSYSATLSLYDCYSSPEGARTQRRSRSCSRDRYHKRSSSVMSGRLAQGQGQGQNYGMEHPRRKSSVGSAVGVSFIIPGEKLVKEQQQQLQIQEQNIEKMLASLPSRTVSVIRGPREQKRPLPRDSVQHSVGLLRRMNSSVSTLSAHESIASEGSPTLPAYRGGGCGVSPTKSFRRGSTNYLGIANGRRLSDTHPLDYSRGREMEKENRGKMIRGMSLRIDRGSRIDGMAVMEEMRTPRPEAGSFSGAMPGVNALGLRMPVLEAPNPTWAMRAVKSSPILAGCQDFRMMESAGSGNVVLRKDSGVDMRNEEVVKKERPARYGGNRPRREPPKKVEEYRESLYDELGFLKSSPERGGTSVS